MNRVTCNMANGFKFFHPRAGNKCIPATPGIVELTDKELAQLRLDSRVIIHAEDTPEPTQATTPASEPQPALVAALDVSAPAPTPDPEPRQNVRSRFSRRVKK